MMKFNRITAILLAAAMLLSMCAFASAEDAPTSGTCGENVTWSFDEETGVMTVSGNAEMEDFWYRTDPGRNNCELVTELVIEDGVQNIGDYAFAGFSQITSVTIPDSVTSIGKGAFAGCTSLETIYIGSGVIEMGFMVGSSIFSHVSDFCPAKAELIQNIYVDEDNPAFADIDGVLFSKNLSTLVYYPKGRPAVHYNVPNGVTTIASGAFSYNSWEEQNPPALETVYLPESVTEIAEYSFLDNTGLVEIQGGAGLERIGHSAINYCPNLTTIRYSGSAEEWAQIEIGEDNNDDLFAAMIYYDYDYAPELPSAWAQAEVDEAITLGLVPHDLQRGYGVGVTREEYCRFVVELVESVSGKSTADFLAERSVSLDNVYFTDTDAEHVRVAGALGVVLGVGEGRFDPDTALTREEAATMLARLAALFTEVDALPYVYDDAPQVSFWARDAVYAMRALGVMHGDNMNLFEPDATYTREAAILTIVRMHKALTDGVEPQRETTATVSDELLAQIAELYGDDAADSATVVGNLLHVDTAIGDLLYTLPDGEHIFGVQNSRADSVLNSGYVRIYDGMNHWHGLLDRDGETVLSTDEHWMFCGTPFDGKVILGKGYPDEYYLWEDGKVTPLPALTGSYIMNDSVGDLYRTETYWTDENYENVYRYGLGTVYGEILPLEYAEVKLTSLGQAFARKNDASPWELYARWGKVCELPDGFAGEFVTDRIAHYAFAHDGEVRIVSTEGVETARVALPEGASFEFVSGLLRITTEGESVYYTPDGEAVFDR